MPIYAYRCESCGHAKDVLQKMSDAPLTVCPSCGASTFTKQLTAAGFQLKGTGWYATDFRGGNSSAPAAKESDGGGTASTTSAAAPAPAKSDSAPAASAGGCGASCACH